MKIDGDLTSHDRAGDFLEADHVRVLLDACERVEQIGFIVLPFLGIHVVILTRCVERAKLQDALRCSKGV